MGNVLYLRTASVLKARLRALVSGLAGNLGGCGFCMRTSFGTALLSWILLLASARLAPPEIILAASVLVLLFTALWLAHLGVYALRATRRAREVDQGRRHSLVVFARTFAIAAAATALPAAMARAQTGCSGGDLSCTHTVSCLKPDGSVPCCPPGTPYLCTIDCNCIADTSNCASYYKCTGQ